jgi:hypothetical protein
MAKKAKPAPRMANPLKTAQAVGLLPAMLMGMPAQVRLAAREQQRAPAFVPKGGKKGRER